MILTVFLYDEQRDDERRDGETSTRSRGMHSWDLVGWSCVLIVTKGRSLGGNMNCYGSYLNFLYHKNAHLQGVDALAMLNVLATLGSPENGAERRRRRR